jgi:hypothetical protein
MTDDPIVAEVRRHRLAYAKRLNYDVGAIVADMQRQTRRHGERVLPCPKRPRPGASGQGYAGGAARAHRAGPAPRGRPTKCG